MPENNKDLANAVRNWINDSGLTQARISANGGPSSTTITKILTGKGSFRQALFGQLDRGLGWGDGGAMAAWRGDIAAAKGFDWRQVSDQELLGEVERRMKGGQAWGGKPGPEEGDEGSVTHAQFGDAGLPDDVAADRQNRRTVQERDPGLRAQRRAGEENQDPGE